MVLGLGWLFGPKSGDQAPLDGSLPSYFPVVPKGCEAVSETMFRCLEEDASNKLREIEQETSNSTKHNDATVDCDPLRVCSLFISQYQKCCDRQLQKKSNWILTESYRVQEEYRYRGGATQPKSINR